MKNFNSLKKISIFLTSSFIIGFEAFRHKVLVDWIGPDIDLFFSSTIFLLGAIIFTHYMFSIIQKVERNRQQKEREAKTIFDNSIDGIFIFNSHLKLIDMNNGAMVMSGWDLSEAVGIQNIYSLFDLVDQVDFSHARTFNNRIENSILKKRDATPLPVSITFSKIDNEKEEDKKIAAVVRDLSERKQMEDVIKDLYQEATQKQHEAETQYKIAKKIASMKDLTTKKAMPILEAVTTEINKLVKSDYTALFLSDYQERSFTLAAITDIEYKESTTIFFHEMYANRMEKDKLHSLNLTDEKKVTFIPLISEETINGYLVIVENLNKNWSLHQQELIKNIVNILSISFENVSMYKKIKDIAILEERERLAREMHDGLAQVISSVNMKVKILEFLVQDSVHDKNTPLTKTINELNHIVNEGYLEVRQNLFSLRTSMNSAGSFIEVIGEYIEQFTNQNKFKVNFEACEMDCDIAITDETKLHVLRILQEALSNVRKHSKATKVEVTYSCENPLFYLFTIEDNGIGFDPDSGERALGHFGLITMKERTELIKGEINIHSKKDVGTKVILKIPKKGKKDE